MESWDGLGPLGPESGALNLLEVVSWPVPAHCLECAVIEKAERWVNGKNTPSPVCLRKSHGSATLPLVFGYS